MTLYQNEMPIKRKNVTRHPWEATIKDEFSSYMKYAHNSVNNPHYRQTMPKTSEKNINLVKFTVIGNRVTDEFIYCVKLVKGVYKYRRKYFDAPTIRGVNGVEWPQVWNDLKVKYGGLAYCLSNQVAVLINDQFLGGENELKEMIESKYTYHICPDYYNEAIAEFSKYIDSSCRPCVYMHFSINCDHIGTMIFMLYSDIVPRTCENFMRLCTEKRGGYAGTPVHRIVKDCWIQCGGFGLKDTQLDCENFIVPHDRRGVLCMANDGRHKDCSTQFFILLQPAPWMEKKYVAFGQLIDGEQTLQIIENVPTWYESPTCEVVIYKAGILNLDCQEIVVCKGIHEYIQGHIENLSELGDVLYSDLIKKVFLELETKQTTHHLHQEEEEEENANKDLNNIRATRRFIRRKEDIDKQIEESDTDNQHSSTVSEQENEEFDVELYESENEYEAEVSLDAPPSSHSKVKPEIPFYIPLTDVPYPGEIDSTHDLKKFLKGHYCLEEDLMTEHPKKIGKAQASYASEMIDLDEIHDSDDITLNSLDTDDEEEIRRYIKCNVDRVSFAGDIVKNIARGVGKFNIFEDARKSELITDEELRRFRLASTDCRTRDELEKFVPLNIPPVESKSPENIIRSQTEYTLPGFLDKALISKGSTSIEGEESSVARKVRIAPTAFTLNTKPSHISRRATGYVRGSADSDTDVLRRSVLTRLYEDVTIEDEPGPTLKDYKPMSEMRQRNILLTFSTNFGHRSNESTRGKLRRPSLKMETPSFDQVMNIQHGKKLVRKVSSDYVKTLDRIEQQFENSIRSIEFAKKRPAMSVAQYQKKNQMFQENLKETKETNVAKVSLNEA
ncbi:unnamed protein product [Parnassius mnemosyne]|uniref:PPIase cyclophilin-type domain-containing protein n=1 Tax=Parnassius mnemosyne TaxID=213953 RepID=A0AAV1KEN7_9NEOP